MNTSIKVLHWTPRILCILAILFLSMFAADSFAPGLTIWQQFGTFFMHLIPTFILLAFLIVAWKWEFIGGIIFTVIGAVFSPILFWFNYSRNHSLLWSSMVLTITVPFIVVGVLFILSHNKKKKLSPAV